MLTHFYLPLADEAIVSNLVFEYLADLQLMVLYQGVTQASDRDWDAYLEVMRQAFQSGGMARSLVVTEGAYPTRSQQSRMTAIVGSRVPRVAVISSSTPLRFVVSILALLNRNVSCFDPSQREAAFRHLLLNPSEQALAQATIERLRRSMTLAATTAA
jgi:hypothetical protein